jgi:hypothetical protein
MPALQIEGHIISGDDKKLKFLIITIECIILDDGFVNLSNN